MRGQLTRFKNMSAGCSFIIFKRVLNAMGQAIKLVEANAVIDFRMVKGNFWKEVYTFNPHNAVSHYVAVECGSTALRITQAFAFSNKGESFSQCGSI